ncbi:DUF2513 domain-containing protein [Metabacillus niabensis]|uniref:DUF2513 domain-containing protein n=1 Tax=Metabacillus niabensis TaxID=324854 RepID=A0ABT9Z8J8_9BACI|nr:DUF2513 domain-containing protein [Metabacillus niabensis]MDQ0228596.1 hypothetical protein [Metabacillus niabensis]
MKRDMDLIRKILLVTEEKDSIYSPMPLEIEGYTALEILYHFNLLKEVGFITGQIMDAQPHVYTLKWEGHNFLDNARNETIWKKTKEFIKEKGDSASFQVVVELLKKFSLKHFEIE